MSDVDGPDPRLAAIETAARRYVQAYEEDARLLRGLVDGTATYEEQALSREAEDQALMRLVAVLGDETPGGTGGLDLGAEVIEWTGPPIGESEIQESPAVQAPSVDLMEKLKVSLGVPTAPDALCATCRHPFVEHADNAHGCAGFVSGFNPRIDAGTLGFVKGLAADVSAETEREAKIEESRAVPAPSVGSRNLIEPEIAEENRTGRPGGYTFNAYPPGDFDGVGFTVACIRLGDHAHIEVESGRVVPGPNGDDFGQRLRMGRAGKLVLRWHEWETLRGILDQHEQVRIAEIENPTPGMVERYAGQTEAGNPPTPSPDPERDEIQESAAKPLPSEKCGDTTFPAFPLGGSYICARPKGHDGMHHSEYGNGASWDDKIVSVGHWADLTGPPQTETAKLSNQVPDPGLAARVVTLRRLAEAATLGYPEWQLAPPDELGRQRYVVAVGAYGPVPIATTHYSDNYAEFIAACDPATVLALLAQLEQR